MECLQSLAPIILMGAQPGQRVLPWPVPQQRSPLSQRAGCAPGSRRKDPPTLPAEERRQAISQSNKKISRVVWAWATPGSVLTKARAAPRGLGKRLEAFLCTGTLTSVRQSPCRRSPQAGLAPSPASSLLSCQRQAGDGGRASRALQTCLSSKIYAS